MHGYLVWGMGWYGSERGWYGKGIVWGMGEVRGETNKSEECGLRQYMV